MTVDTTEIVKMIRGGDKLGMQIYLRKGGDPNARNQMCWTLLHLACFEGQMEIAEILLDGGASVNSCTTDMSTPLHRACAQGNKTVVEMLVKKGAYVNAQDKNGNTPLHEASRGLHTSIVRLLFEKKADRTKVNRKKQTFLNLIGQQLMPSVESGDSEVLQQWLEWGASPDTKGNLHWSILHHACARGQLNIASLLIERGADVNIEDSNKTSPLHSACFHGHSRIASLLIDSNANINAQDQRGNTPLHSAISGCHPEMINLLLERGCDTTIINKEGQYFTHLVNEFLVTAVQGSKIGQVVSLLKGRADPNTKDPYGYTVLCQAAFQGEMMIADALLEGGADPNLPDDTQGKTPLHYAAAWGHLFVVKSLLDMGASVNVKDKVGATPLHEACREGFEDVIVVLMGRGASVNAMDESGNTPLHVAGKWGQNDIVELLLEKNAKDNIRNKSNLLYSDLALIRAVRTADKGQVVAGMAWGGDPNSRDKRGWTLLHHAVYKGVQDICELLLESGANVNAVDVHDRTPLLLAAYRGNPQVMQILLDAGADINAQDWMGRTPLHWAAKEGSIDTVQLLLDHKANTTIRNKEGQLYSTMLLKHLYFAVRHNDADKVVRLVSAGADQFAEVEGTGVNPREEAKRRGFFDILRLMATLVQKKPQEDDKVAALEDVYRLFDDAIITEDGDFTTRGEDQEKCEEEEQQDEEQEEEVGARDESEEDDYDEEAYWKMSNAYEVLTVEEAFGNDDCDWLKEFEEKPKVISAKDLLEEEQAAFWDGWQEKQKVISAKEFFKEKSDWWENNDDDDDEEEEEEEEKEDKNEDEESNDQSSNNEYSRDDECWWRDAQENLEKPKPISAKEYFQEEKPWWANGKDEEEKVDSPEEYFTNDKPWWQSEEQKSNVISVKEFCKDDNKPWWEEEEKEKAISAKEYFQEEKPWWQDEEKEKATSAKEFFKEEVPWWQEEKAKVISAKEFFKDEELPWWHTEEMCPEKPEGLKKSLASARFFERYAPKKQNCGEDNVLDEAELSDDEIEESTRTDDYEDATDSINSDSSTMYSASEGERLQSSTEFSDIPWWKESTPQEGEQRQKIPKADDFFHEKHWLDDASDSSEPTETLDMDTSEIATATDLSHSECVIPSPDVANTDGSEGSDEESDMDEECYDVNEEEAEEEESGELEGEEELEEEEGDIDDEMDEEECDSESEEVKSEDEIEDISDEELEEVELKANLDATKEVSNLTKVDVMLDQKITDDIIIGQSKISEIQKQISIPSIVLHEIGNEGGNDHITNSNKERRRDNKAAEDFHSIELVSKVVSKSYDSLAKENTNIDVGETNNDSLIDPNQYSISVHDIEGNLQKSDSQTSGYDSSLSLSDSKARDLSRDSGCEALSVDECVEDTDISDITNPASTETVESLEESISSGGGQSECECASNSVQDIQLIAKENGGESQETVKELGTAKNPVEKDDSQKIVIQMKWDTEGGDTLDQSQTETLTDTSVINNSNKIITQIHQNMDTTEKQSFMEIQQMPKAESTQSDYKTDVKGQKSENEENHFNQPQAKTYATVLKASLEKTTVNKMDDCLARLDASLAWVDARLTKESEERTSNENLREKMNGDKEITYAGAVKKGTNLPVTENKSKISEGNGDRKLDNEVKSKEEKETIQFMKVHVRVPEEGSITEDERTELDAENGSEKRRFAGGTIPKRPKRKEPDAHRNIKYASQLPKELNVDSKDGIPNIVNEEACTMIDSSSTKEEEKVSIAEKVEEKEQIGGHSKEHIQNETTPKEDNAAHEINVKEEMTSVELKEVKTNDCVEVKEKNSSCKEKENILLTDDQEKQSTSGTLKNEASISEESKETTTESTESKELSRESSLERLSPHRGSESPGLQPEKTLWRCSTYDAMSLSDYDNLAFMIQKSSSSPACWGSKKKRKEHSDNIDSLDQKDILTQDSCTESSDKQQGSSLLHTTESKEKITPIEKESDVRIPPEMRQKHIKESKTSIDDARISSDVSTGNDTHKNVPEASSKPLPKESKVLGAEACTNLRDISCNQDQPVAPRRNKEHSLQSEKVKYKVADHSADTQPSHAHKQPTNTTLYDPDKKETSKVEAAVNVRPDEPRVQQVSTKRSKKDKEKQKELAVATSKVDPVRKSSSCSVS